MPRGLTALAVVVFALISGSLPAAERETAPPRMVAQTDPVFVGSPPFRRLFLDPMVVEESGNLDRVFYAAKKYEGNPIFVEEKPWERDGPKLGGRVIRVDGKLRMYYLSQPRGGGGANCIAESFDGIHWTRPNLGTVEYGGSRDNNIIGSLVRNPFRLANPQSPDRAWVTYEPYDGGMIAWSADGLNWVWDKEHQGKLFGAGDSVAWFYDPYNKRMAATWKCASRRHRSCGIVWSDDGLNWTKPVSGPVMVPDGLDPDATQIYGMPVFAYQGMYIGLPLIYHARWIKYGRYSSADVMHEAEEGSPLTMDVQLAWSWDLINWTRTPKREPFVALGPTDSFDNGMILTAKEPLLMGDEIWFYYTGHYKPHERRGQHTAIGLAKLRLDGFCSMRARGKQGWLISRREVFNTPRVTINAACQRGGYITAELVDRNNTVIPGFEADKCVRFTGDSVRGQITWRTPAFPKELIDKDKKVKFHIKNADLYSYTPVDVNRSIDDGWPDH